MRWSDSTREADRMAVARVFAAPVARADPPSPGWALVPRRSIAWTAVRGVTGDVRSDAMHS